MSAIRFLLILLAVAGLQGCAASRTVAPAPDLSKPVASGMSRFVAYRPSAWTSSAVAFSIYDNGKKVGEVGSNGWIAWEREKGAVKLTSDGENNDILPINAEDGKTYAVYIDWTAGFIGYRTNLMLVDPANIEKWKTADAPMLESDRPAQIKGASIK